MAKPTKKAATVKMFLCILIGVTLILLSLVQYLFMPKFVKLMVIQNMVLSPDSPTTQQWIHVPVPIYNRFYFFNITNFEDVLAKKSLPIVEELGPYTFREHRDKFDLVWNDSNGTVTYRQKSRFYFEPELTNGSLDDIIWHINLPMVAAGSTFKSMTGGLSFFTSIVEEIIIETQSNLFLNHTIGEMLFDGYEDGIISFGSNFVETLPGEPVIDKFGFMYKRNDTSRDGVYEVYTGRPDVGRLGMTARWNYGDQVDNWKGECNWLNNTYPGELQPPFVSRSPLIRIFNGDLCRPLILTYEKDVEFRGLRLRRYVIDESMFDYSLDRNKCYCPEDGCPADGVIEQKACAKGAPIAMSLPHFLFANDSYRDLVHGMRPDKDLHQFVMDIEPTLGIAVRTAGRLQVNVAFQRNENLFFANNLTHKIYYPQFWSEVAAVIPDEQIFQLDILLNKLPLILSVASLTMLAIGAILLNVGALLALRLRRRIKSVSSSLSEVGSSSTLRSSSPSTQSTSTGKSRTSKNNQKYIPVRTDAIRPEVTTVIDQ